jgi:hypothetical protein
VYLEWINPISRSLPTREQLSKHGIEVLTSNFIDDGEHKQAPDLARLGTWLSDAGFTIIASGAVDLGILGEELFARGADRDSRSMGYWSMTRSSLYTVAIKSSEAAVPARERHTAVAASPATAERVPLPAAAGPSASADLQLLRVKRALLVSGLFDAVFYRASYADMRAATVEPLTHYLTVGEAEGRSPNAVFSPRYYRRRWMAGLPGEQSALLHYIEEGEEHGAKPHPAFDPQAYLAANPPLAEFVDRPLFHYLTIGLEAGLPVAPGPHGEKLARVLAAQPHAIDFEYSGRRNQEPVTRYKEALMHELGPEEGAVLYKEMFGPPDADEPDAHAGGLTEERPTGPDTQAERSAHHIHPVSRELPDIGVPDQEELPDSPSEQLEHWLQMSESIPGTTRGELARELARVSSSLPSDAIIVEIGAFMGSATVLLAGPRQMRGSGRVHVVDPFDCSGDPRSTPIYERVLQAAGGGSLLDHFVENIRRAGLSGWIEMHQGRAPEIAASWTTPVDMIYIDLDVSGEAAGEAYDSWCHLLKPGGIIVVHNSDPEDHRPSENPDRRPIEDRLRPPSFTDVRIVDGNTFARKATAAPGP